jgi:SAM-dependent methyltransferase
VTSPSGDFDPKQYWERRLEPFDLSAVGYLGLGLGYNRWMYRVRHRVFQHLVRSIDDGWEERQVLDVGSGTGFYVSEWLKAGVSVTGSDLTRISVEGLRKAFPALTFVEWDVTDAPPFEPSSFDAVSAFDVLFHIVDEARYRAAFANVANLLKDGGYFLLAEPFLHRETVRVRHQVSRPLEAIEALLDETGFDIVTRRPMFVLMNPPIDSANRALRGYWRLLEGLLTRAPALGGIVGAILYPAELALISLRTESPTTEVMVCRKRGGDARPQRSLEPPVAPA